MDHECRHLMRFRRLVLPMAAALLGAVGARAAEQTEPTEPLFVISVEEQTPLAGAAPLPAGLVGFNIPAGHTPEQTRGAAVYGPGTNGNWDALGGLNPGFIRVWVNALEFGLDSMQLPPYDAGVDGSWAEWLDRILADSSPFWDTFDQRLAVLGELGDEVELMLCLPTFPPWLGPFRAVAEEADCSTLRDMRTGQTVPYSAFTEWAGIERHIVEAERFERFRERVSIYVERLVAHCLATAGLRERVRYLSIGNEPDNAGSSDNHNPVRWRLWVYGPGFSKLREEYRDLPLTQEGLLQQLYLAADAGYRRADPEGRLRIGGPESAWAHFQKQTAGAFYYLGYFIDGSLAFHGADGKGQVMGVGRERVDFLSYHFYSIASQGKTYGGAAADLHEAYGKDILLTEYNATAEGHGMNFMQSGATAVAAAVIQSGRLPYVKGAAFFKASGGGFGLLLRRSDEPELRRTGAYWALKLVREWLVDGIPVATSLAPGAAAAGLDALVVRHAARETQMAALLVNSSDAVRRVQVARPGHERALEGRILALPLARSRNDYRHVGEEEIISLQRPAGEPLEIDLAPRGVVFLRW